MSEESAPTSVEGETEELRQKLGLVRVGEVLLAVPGEACAGVVELEEASPLPLAPAHVSGVVLLRNTIVPILDLATLFDVAPEGPNRTGLGIEAEQSRLVLAVEEIVNFDSLVLESVESSQNIATHWRGLCSEVLRIRGVDHDVPLLDLSELFKTTSYEVSGQDPEG